MLNNLQELRLIVYYLNLSFSNDNHDFILHVVTNDLKPAKTPECIAV